MRKPLLALALMLMQTLPLASLAPGCAPTPEGEGELNHRDDPLSRSGNSAAPRPWHMHSGNGFSRPDAYSLSTPPCRLQAGNSLCDEGVYYFSEVSVARAFAAAQRTAHLKEGAAATLGLSPLWGLRGGLLKSIRAFPASSWRSKAAVLIGSVVVAIGLTGFFGNRQQANAVKHLLATERAFVARCGHVRKNFLSQAVSLGVTIEFRPEYPGAQIPAQQYFAAKEQEEALYRRTFDAAKEQGLSCQDAYEKVFLTSCDQLPSRIVRHPDWFDACLRTGLPAPLAEQLQEANAVLALDSGLGIRLQMPPKNLDGKRQRALAAFLTALTHGVSAVTQGSPPATHAALSALRRDIHEIIVRPGPPRIAGHRFHSFAEIVVNEQRVLVMYLFYDLRQREYRVSMRPISDRLRPRGSL